MLQSPAILASESVHAAGSVKTVEGTLGGIVCTLAAWAVLFAVCCCVTPALSSAGSSEGTVVGLGLATGVSWAGLAVATAAACLLEAATTQLDNIFVPLQYFALLCAASCWE